MIVNQLLVSCTVSRSEIIGENSVAILVVLDFFLNCGVDELINGDNTGDDIVENLKVFHGNLAVAVSVSNYVVLIEYDVLVECESVSHVNVTVLIVINVKECLKVNIEILRGSVVKYVGKSLTLFVNNVKSEVLKGVLSSAGEGVSGNANRLEGCFLKYGDCKLTCIRGDYLELESYKSKSALNCNVLRSVSSDADETGGLSFLGYLTVCTADGLTLDLVYNEGGEYFRVELVAEELEGCRIILNGERDTPNVNALVGIKSYGYLNGRACDVGLSVSGENDLKTGTGALNLGGLSESLAANLTCIVVVTSICVVLSNANLYAVFSLSMEFICVCELNVVVLNYSVTTVNTVVVGVAVGGAGRLNFDSLFEGLVLRLNGKAAPGNRCCGN